jgi:hypothetical protein
MTQKISGIETLLNTLVKEAEASDRLSDEETKDLRDAIVTVLRILGNIRKREEGS